MWPMLLNMTHDECRLTLRRLELEAYSNMVNVFRAQGALEDNRKKLLEELRAVLHISQDRHSAEARRVSNDQLLATIAEHISGPNTGLGWISEGRRRIPLLPRGIPQTMYTEIADKAAEMAAAENKEILKRLEEKLVASKTNEEEIVEEEQISGSTQSSNDANDVIYPPIAMEDQTAKLWETELISRKRKVSESGPNPDNSVPAKNKRNININTNQKHLNLSKIYSKFSQPASGKPPGQSKHSYNQVSKVSTSKSSQTHAPRAPHKPRAPKTPRITKSKKAQGKKAQEIPLSPSKQYSPALQLEYAGPPNTFQASYAQAVLGAKQKPDYMDEVKSKAMSPSMITESQTMKLLTQPPTIPHELEISENSHPNDPTPIQMQSTPFNKQILPNKPSPYIIKGRSDIDKKPQTTEVKLPQKPLENVKVSNRQVVVAPGATQKVLSTPGKFVTTKVIGSIPKTRTISAPMTEKMIVVSKPTSDSRNLSSSRLIVTSAVSTPNKERVVVNTSSNVARITETLTPKGIPATDLKVSAKAVVLNQKSGQKMVVVPAKSRTKPSEGQIPLLHFKGISTAMKLVPVSSQTIPQGAKPTLTVTSKPSTMSSFPTTTKIIGMEPIKTANLADIVPVKGLTPVTASKISSPIVRPSSAKGNVIVVQKGSTIGKALTFAKNGNDMSKIIMGKNVTQLLQATKSDHTEAGKPPGNVIVLELNNEHSGRTTTMSEILDSRGSSTARLSSEKKTPQITADTPVLFGTQLTEETCNTSSLDSTIETESIGGIVPMDSGLSIMEKDDKSQYSKDSEGAKDSSSITDWEIELDSASRKDKDDDDKLNSLHLDLGMSSDSDTEYMATGRKSKSKHSSQDRQRTVTGGVGEAFSGCSSMTLATRTLLSQLQDDGSSSNDSSFALRAKVSKVVDHRLDKAESEALTKAKEKLSEKVAEAKSQQKRIDIYSTAITPSEINLDSFGYLDESIMGDDVFEEKTREGRRDEVLHDHLSRLLGEDSAHSTDSQTVSDIPLSK